MQHIARQWLQPQEGVRQLLAARLRRSSSDDEEFAVCCGAGWQELHPGVASVNLCAARGVCGSAIRTGIAQVTVPHDLRGGGLEREELRRAGHCKDQLVSPKVTELLRASGHFGMRDDLRAWPPPGPLWSDQLEDRGDQLCWLLQQLVQPRWELAKLCTQGGKPFRCIRSCSPFCADDGGRPAVKESLMDGGQPLFANPSNFGALDASEGVVGGRDDSAMLPGTELMHQQQLGRTMITHRVTRGVDGWLHIP
mmetsp:Transcript_139221/g.388507  ORF Transcript_139221/g.388507 Transcript_139221/m.388507 type:complete len:252 (-) Transcript_139221:1094-1849(-)